MIKGEVILEDNGLIRVNGPINNKVLTLGLLEAAKFAVMTQVTAPSIEVPDFPPNFKI